MMDDWYAIGDGVWSNAASGFECPFQRPVCQKPIVSFREEFRAPLGVRKSPRNEPGAQTMVYGYFGFRLSLATSGPAVGRARRDAICRNRRWIGRPCGWGSPSRGSFEALLTSDGANSKIGRGGGAAAGDRGRQCH